MVILAGHCLLTGHYFETRTSSVIRLFPRIMAEGSYYFFHTKKGTIILREGDYSREAIISNIAYWKSYCRYFVLLFH